MDSFGDKKNPSETMINAKSLKGLIVVFLVILSSSLIMAEDKCWITDETTCSGSNGNAILRLSDVSNAHAENATQTNYGWVLCCNFGSGNTNCDGTNKVLSLSSDTNAHAEIPDISQPQYAVGVCYEDLVCTGVQTSDCPQEYNVPFNISVEISLSSDTNAHLGNVSDYAVKLCCKHNYYCGDGIVQTLNGEECDDGNTADGDGCSSTCTLETESFWSLDGSTAIFSLNVVPGSTTVLLVSRNTGLAENTEVTFQVYETDLIQSDLIKTISGTVNADGNAVAEWTITQEDLDTASNGEWGSIDAFYFEVPELPSGGISNDLSISISSGIFCSEIITCASYGDESSCNQDLCGVADSTIESSNANINCTDGSVNCECVWTPLTNECQATYSSNVSVNYTLGDGIISPGEQCDGTNIPAGVDCTTFGYSSGSISCTSSGIINVSSCTGLPAGGFCGDGDINLGEQCDGMNISSISCTDFGFAGGSVSCTSNCLVDTSQCTGNEVNTTPLSIGTCSYTEITTDDCEDGYLSYSLKANWQWDPNNVFALSYGEDAGYVQDESGWHYDPQGLAASCQDGETVIPCPAKIALPFFTFANIIIVILIIALIYFIIRKNKNSATRRRHHGKRKK